MRINPEKVLFFIFGAMGIGLVFYLPIWLSSAFSKPIDKTVYIFLGLDLEEEVDSHES